jgi:hypothetical protein
MDLITSKSAAECPSWRLLGSCDQAHVLDITDAAASCAALGGQREERNLPSLASFGGPQTYGQRAESTIMCHNFQPT